MKLVSPSKARFLVSMIAVLFVGGALGQDPLGYGVFSKINAAYNQWHLFDRVSGVSSRAAWASSTGGSIVVAVVDSGIVAHPDLAASTLPGYDFVSGVDVSLDGGGRDSNPTDPGDSCEGLPSSWHGTKVAGLIAANPVGSSEGGRGIAPAAKLLPIRVTGLCGRGLLNDVVDGVKWAAGVAVAGAPANPYPAKVINISVGGASPASCPVGLQNAINLAIERGSLVVVAASNDNQAASLRWPANCAGVLAVASVDKDGRKTFSSNYGAPVALSAPGGEGNEALWTTSVAPSGQYDYGQLGGTGAAAALVSGQVALLRAVLPLAGVDEIKRVVTTYTKAFPAACEGCGQGISNLAKSVDFAIGKKIRAVADFDGDGWPDILWGSNNGGVAIYRLVNSEMVSASAVADAPVGFSLLGVGDFNSDGRADIVWRNLGTGSVLITLMNGATSISRLPVGQSPIALNTRLEAVGDFNGDGRADMLWRNQSTGRSVISYHNADGSVSLWSEVSKYIDPVNTLALKVGDINGDGKSDIVWRNAVTGNVVISIMNGSVPTWVGITATPISLSVELEGVGDFDGNGRDDLLWRNTLTGRSVLSYHGSNGAITSWPVVSNYIDPVNTRAQGVADFNRDGRDDILWRNETTGSTVFSHMQGAVPSWNALSIY